MMMRGLQFQAEFRPKDSYLISEKETREQMAYHGNDVWYNPKLELVEKEIRPLKSKEVLIKIAACGVCGSDIHFLGKSEEGYLKYTGHCSAGTILGHEYSGEIVQVGKAVTSLKAGDLVVADTMNWCGECAACRMGLFNQCENLEELGFTKDGGFATYMIAEAKYCCKVNDFEKIYGSRERALDVAALLEPMSVAYTGMFIGAGGIRPGDYVAVTGTGPVGLSAIALAKAAGAAKVFAIDIVAERMEIAKKMGADVCINSKELQEGETVADILMRETNNTGIMLHVEATGQFRFTMNDIQKTLAYGGRTSMIGMGQPPAPVDPRAYQGIQGKLCGSIGGAGQGAIPAIIRLIECGKLDPSVMIAGEYSLDEVLIAFEKARNGIAGKLLVKP